MNTINALITDAKITADDHGCLTVWLMLDYGGYVQGFGGHVLYLPKGCERHSMTSLAGHFIWRVLEVADVTSWAQLKGKTIRVQQDNTGIKSIGHIINEDWFCPSEDFANLEVK